MCALAQSRSTAGSCGSCNSLQRILARAAYARTWSVSENWAVASQVQLCVLLCKYHEFHDAMAIAHRALRSQSEGIFPHGRERNMLLWIKINCAEELGVGDDGGSSSTHWPPWEYADDDRLLSSSHISLYGACMVVSCSEGGVRDAIEYITGRMCSSTSCGCGCAGAGRGGASDSAAGIECTDVGVGVEQIPRDLQGPQQRQQHSAMDLTSCGITCICLFFCVSGECNKHCVSSV
eukprot:m.641586 g.641586  ORF g.641586 m.641586 type:complete len:235 (+) comp22631_c1_seq13:112-816(+)